MYLFFILPWVPECLGYHDSIWCPKASSAVTTLGALIALCALIALGVIYIFQSWFSLGSRP